MHPGLILNLYEKNALQASFFMKPNAPQARLHMFLTVTKS